MRRERGLLLPKLFTVYIYQKHMEMTMQTSVRNSIVRFNGSTLGL